ncbi:MAG: pyridoxamine 5-phosphate oxidase [Chloroflexota bacterium]|jgi:pyridoxamine 5'-phosphate oxidase|nr:pyridoxamine 5-phosphate oxidase [Chloroflexota bacterium]
MPIDPATLDPDPIRQLAAWLADASATSLPLPNAFALATADDEGMPSVRFVLLNGLDADGLRYFTYRGSRKGRDVAINPYAAAAFWWPSLDRQARVNGSVRLLSDADSLAYWRTRPRGSQLSATVSAQGQEVASREELEARVAELAARNPGELPLPPMWGGYLIVPRIIEFWESRPDRLHDRIEYRRGGDGSWNRRRLEP